MHTSQDTNEEHANLEQLHGIRLDESGMTVWVVSSGLTAKEHFEPYIEWGFTGEKAMFIRITRIKRDTGKAMPRSVPITFSWAELNPQNRDVSSFELQNRN